MYIFNLHKKNKSVLRLFLELSCFAVLVWLAIALFSYYKYDPSFLYYTTEYDLVTNSCGSWGAHMAAFVFYLFGGAAYACLFSLMVVWTVVVQRTFVEYTWEQITGALILPFIIAALMSAYWIDSVNSFLPGGALGFLLYSKINTFLGPLCTLMLLHVILIIALFILSPTFYLTVASYICYACQKIYSFMVAYRVVHHLGAALLYILRNAIVKPIEWIYHFTVQLITGKLFEATDLVVPDPAYHIKELIELHQLLQNNREPASLQGARIEKYEQKNLYDLDNDIDTLIENQQSMLASSGLSAQEDIMYEQDTSVNFSPEHLLPQKKNENSSLHKMYQLPSVDLFIGVPKERHDETLKQALQERAQLLEKKLERFGVVGTVVAIKRGPVVTLFEYLPHMDTKLSKIIGLEDDLAMALQALSIRIIAPIPGTAVVGFEVANMHRTDVMFSSIIKTDAYTQFKGGLPLVLGQDTVGKEVIVDLARMPHLLIAGSTGSGKSVALNVMLISLLCKLSPSQLRLVLIDPKRLEFMSYADIGHLLFPIVTDPKKVVHILRWVVQEMEDRYKKMSQIGVRHLFDYNEKIKNDPAQSPLPFIVVVIDELSDLMLTVGRDIEDLITRITQMARAAGIHMMVATQRPSVDVITGLIKVNFPSRISFRVTSRIDSRTILDCNGADKLLGRGDMLFLDAVNAQLNRVHGAFVSTDEIEKVVTHIRAQGPPLYLSVDELVINDKQSTDEQDELYQEVVSFLQETDDISISLLQRKFRIGYNRSARIIDMLESHGLIMPLDGSKTRKVIR